MRKLTPFSYAILALVGDNGAGPHDIVQMMRRGRLYWTAAESHYYSEPKRLEKLGYLTSRKEPGRTHARTHYMLTPRGRGALRSWVGEPASLPRIQNEAIVKLLAADIAGDEAVLESFRALRAEIAEASTVLAASEEIAATIPKRERYLLLVHSLGRAILEAHAEWLDRVERELGRENPPE
jgi:DNA-binding PadR family transcriptional regulator